MSDIIKVDTDHVSNVADNIDHFNKKIRDDFTAVETAVKSLGSTWVGSASEPSIGAFHDIKNTYSETRYQVVDNFVKFLKQQVDPSYEQTETSNTSLADQFK